MIRYLLSLKKGILFRTYNNCDFRLKGLLTKALLSLAPIFYSNKGCGREGCVIAGKSRLRPFFLFFLFLFASFSICIFHLVGYSISIFFGFSPIFAWVLISLISCFLRFILNTATPEERSNIPELPSSLPNPNKCNNGCVCRSAIERAGARAPSLFSFNDWEESHKDISSMFLIVSCFAAITFVAVIDFNLLRAVSAALPSGHSGPTPSVFAVLFFQVTGILSLFFQFPALIPLILKRKEKFFLIGFVSGPLPVRIFRFLAVSTAIIILIAVVVAWFGHLYFAWPAISDAILKIAKKKLVSLVGSGFGFSAAFLFVRVVYLTILLISLPLAASIIVLAGPFLACQLWRLIKLAWFIDLPLGRLSWFEFKAWCCYQHSFLLLVYLFCAAKIKWIFRSRS